MKYSVLAAALAFGVAACGGGGGNAKAKLVKACMAEDGSTQSECDCMADAAVEKLDPKLLNLMVKAAESGDDSDAAMSEMMAELEPDEMSQFMSFAMEAGMTCGLAN